MSDSLTRFIGVYFGGQRLVRPQAATVIDDSGMYARGVPFLSTLALIGEATGGEPQKVLWFTDPSYAKAILRSGPLLQAIQRAYAPSSESNGAYLVAAIRVNPATAGSLVLRDASGNPLILISSVDYGTWVSQLKVRVEAPTVLGKKVTVTYGTSYDQRDDIYRKSLFLSLSDPKARSGTCTVSIGSVNKTLTTSIVANFQNICTDVSGTPADITPAAKEVGTLFLVGMTDHTTDSIYLGSDRQFASVTFNRGGGVQQDVVTTLSAKYNKSGVGFSAVAALNDGTKGVDGKPFSTDGNITFTLPSDWVKSTYNSKELYWIKLEVAGNLTAGAQGDYFWLNRGLNVNLSSYPTVQELVDYLDSQGGYESDAITSSPNSEYSIQLDDVSTKNFFGGGNTLLTADYTVLTSTTLIVADNTSFVAGDYISIARADASAEETRKVAAVSGGDTITIDFPLSTTYITGSVVREAIVLNSDLQAVIDWFNSGETTYVTAAYHASAINRAAVVYIPDTYLSGGAEGTTIPADWDTCLDLLKTEDTPLVSCISYDPSVWASLNTHCEYMSALGKKERIGFCGGFATIDGYTSGLGKWSTASEITNSINKLGVYSEDLNSDRMVYVGPGFIAYDEYGIKTTYNGAIAAALVAGMAAGVDVATALTHKEINVIGLEYNLRWGDLDRLLEKGVCPLEYNQGVGYRVCQSITTWLKDNKYNRRELSVRRTADYVARQVRDRLDRDFVGKKGTSSTLISIKNATISMLQQMYRLELLAGDQNNPPYKNVQVRLDGDVCWVDFECSPVIPVNYILCTIHLTVFQTTLSV